MSGDGQIRALDERTVQRIAAGEVVERPASVVKELVENSLDAGANRVDVAVENGGVDGVRVRDDGAGMPPDELARAVEKHTTSKIRDIDDLESGVGTLGFRGEALHTIGAVSELTVRSRPRESDAVGHELVVEGGTVGEVRPTGTPPGTTVEVDRLFYNTPARRKFLKTEATEFDHVNTVVTQYALANPGVAISLTHNDREVFATEGAGDLRSTVLSVYGRAVAESMEPVEWRLDQDDTDHPVVSVSGLVSHPETTRAGREYLSTFVNDRYVRARVLRQAVLDAYGGQLAPDRYPFAVLFLSVSPETVDVNVHPRKMEVRFDEEGAVTAAVEAAVREALLEAGLVRSGAPRGRSAPAETAVEPGTASEPETAGEPESTGETVSEDVADESAGESAHATPGGEDRSFGEGEERASSDRDWAVERQSTPERRLREARADTADEDDWGEWPAPDASGEVSTESGRGGASDRSDSRPEASVDTGATAGGSGDTPTASGDAGGDGESEDGSAADVGFEWPGATDAGITGPTTQQTLTGGEAGSGTEFENLPAMRVLGQVHETYVVAETDDGLVLVDQHAADERIHYERLREEFAGDTTTQALADPVELELTAREAALFEPFAEALSELGFRAERTGDRTVEVRSVPAVFDATLDPDLLRDALTAFVADDRDGGTGAVDAVADELLADLACYPAITGNTSLTEGSVVDLLSALDDCENPWACPHGRPVVIAIGSDEIATRFERDYPGHAGRRAEE